VINLNEPTCKCSNPFHQVKSREFELSLDRCEVKAVLFLACLSCGARWQEVTVYDKRPEQMSLPARLPYPETIDVKKIVSEIKAGRRMNQLEVLEKMRNRIPALTSYEFNQFGKSFNIWKVNLSNNERYIAHTIQNFDTAVRWLELYRLTGKPYTSLTGR
jgi:hypothetical protein